MIVNQNYAKLADEMCEELSDQLKLKVFKQVHYIGSIDCYKLFVTKSWFIFKYTEYIGSVYFTDAFWLKTPFWKSEVKSKYIDTFEKLYPQDNHYLTDKEI